MNDEKTTITMEVINWIYFELVSGSAIGLGAMWKFPYMAGIYGGSAFLAMFLIFTILLDYHYSLWNSLLGKWDGHIQHKYIVN
ncbi:hypothetical protein UM590_09245 [Staphylococcus aureus]|nr:hypothetical protein UM590_09245 [Staphylococcus aureus]